MIYAMKAEITLDTATNKVVIETGVQSKGNYKRIVLFPGKKLAEHWVDASLNDRPQGPFNHAKDVCKFLVRTLHGHKQIIGTIEPAGGKPTNA